MRERLLINRTWGPYMLNCQVNELFLYQTPVISMEKDIIKTLKWNLTVPTSYVFLVRFTGPSTMHDKEVNCYKYFCV